MPKSMAQCASCHAELPIEARLCPLCGRVSPRISERAGHPGAFYIGTVVFAVAMIATLIYFLL